jgi:hypothetical protein
MFRNFWIDIARKCRDNLLQKQQACDFKFDDVRGCRIERYPDQVRQFKHQQITLNVSSFSQLQIEMLSSFSRFKNSKHLKQTFHCKYLRSPPWNKRGRNAIFFFRLFLIFFTFVIRNGVYVCSHVISGSSFRYNTLAKINPSKS